MKKLFTSMIFVFVLFFAQNYLAQTAASVQWDCVADQKVTTTVGNVLGQPEVGSTGFYVRDYTGGNSNGPLSSTHQRWWPYDSTAKAAVSWGLETDQVNTRYVQFQVSPKSGNDFTVTACTLYMAAGGTNLMRANVSYSLDASFASPTLINTGAIMLKQGSANPQDTVITFSGNVKVSNGKSFYLRVYPWYTGSNSTSKYVYLQAIKIEGTTSTASAVKDLNLMPTEFSLNQNYPNPFNPSTKISFSLAHDGNAKLVVFNILGEKVATLVNSNMTAGTHDVSFDASTLPTGVYIYQLTSANQSIVKKMVLIK